MDPNINNSFSLTNTYKDAKAGMKWGAALGGAVTSYTVVIGVMSFIYEKANRFMGNEPKWPQFDGDCDLPQFRDLTACTEKPVFSNVAYFAATVTGATTVAGAFLGGLNGLSKDISIAGHKFITPHSHRG